MTETRQHPARARLRQPALDRPTAMRLAATEYGRFVDLLRRLDPADWSRPTDCTEWSVRDTVGHVVGMTRMVTSLREILRQNKAACRRGGVPIDALTALQVEEHAHLETGELIDRMEALAPRAVRGRRRMPWPLRRMPLPDPQEVDGVLERWSNGYLVDVILTRDTWMHRMDLCRATGREPVLTADHDGVLVADVVEEWADRLGRPFSLHLDGPAGGSWSRGAGGPSLQLDAVDFCRVVSGRGEADGLLTTSVPF